MSQTPQNTPPRSGSPEGRKAPSVVPPRLIQGDDGQWYFLTPAQVKEDFAANKAATKAPPVIHVVNLKGSISDGGPGTININNLDPLLTAAFNKPASAVVLVMNSPGGSPSQSELVARRIKQLREESKIPVYVFVEDMCASGGYWIAVVADKIFALPTSNIGSIGVISEREDRSKELGKKGVKVTQFTAGKHKGYGSPARALEQQEIDERQKRVDELHQIFINHVKKHRGSRITGSDDEVFEANVHLGDEALRLGMIDGVDDLRSWITREFGKDARMMTLALAPAAPRGASAANENDQDAARGIASRPTLITRQKPAQFKLG